MAYILRNQTLVSSKEHKLVLHQTMAYLIYNLINSDQLKTFMDLNSRFKRQFECYSLPKYQYIALMGI